MPGFNNKYQGGPPMNFRGPMRGYNPYGGSGDHELDPNSDQFRKLFIGGLSFDTDETSLKNYFTEYGEMTDVVVMRDPQSKRSRGFGFITFAEKGSIDSIQKKRPHRIDNREVETKRAMPKDDPTPNNQATVDKMFLGGMKDDTTEEQIREVFGEYGEIKQVELINDKNTGKIKGFCFITFDDYDSVDKAVLKKRVPLNGRKVEVKKAISKDQMNMGGPMGRGMGIPMGRGGRGDFNNYGGGYGGPGYNNFGYNSFGGGYGQGWQGGYNDFGPGYGPGNGGGQSRYNNYGNNYGSNNYNNRR